MADQPTKRPGTNDSGRQPDTAEPRSGAHARRLRKRSAQQTEQEILRAAAQRFARAGYASVRLKDIAADAGVTAALIVRYFGSKLDLFRAVLRESSPARVDDDVLAGPLETLGLRLAKSQVAAWLTPEMTNAPVAAMRSLDVEEARSLLSIELSRRFIDPLTAALPGPNPQIRAKVIVSHMLSLGLFALCVLFEPEAPPPSTQEIHDITRLFGAALQTCITAQ